MKYIADTITGVVLMTREIEVEIDDTKLEAALEKEAHNESCWEDKPTDELWIDVYSLVGRVEPDDDEIEKKGDAIVNEWEALPDYVKTRDVTYDYVERMNLCVQACKQWLKSKGWAPLPEDDDVWFRKKREK